VLTKENLVQDLKNLGVKSGDHLYIHTALKSIGDIDGGAETLIDALLTAVGEQGTIAVPTHTCSFEDAPFGTTPYDKTKTDGILGVFPNILWKHPQAKRSGHGSHSTAAIGKLAEYLTENHDPTHALGENSPLYRLYKSGGKILLLGVGMNRVTILHMAESMAKVPYVKLPYNASWGFDVLVNSGEAETERHVQVEFPGCSEMFPIFDDILGNKISRAKVGQAPAALMDAQELVDTAVAELKKDNSLLLCSDENCCCCAPRKQYF